MDAQGDAMTDTIHNQSLVPSSDTVLLGLIGAGIGLSRMPALLQTEAAAQGLAGVYRLIDIDRLGLTPADLPDLLTAAERFGFAGLNITFPCKQAVLAHLHELSPQAAALGAVNTVVLRDGRRVGHNTDCSGYASGFAQNMAGADLSRVVMFGAGGAGVAVGYALLQLGASELTIIEPDPARAASAASQLGAHFPDRRVLAGTDAQAAVAAATGVVNATPIGMAKYPGMPFPAEWLRAELWVSEIIYFPLETELLRQARLLGCRTLDGSAMNIHQAADAFRLFTGREADPKRMRRTFDLAAPPV